MRRWHQGRRMLKLRYNVLAKWRTLAERLGLPRDRVTTELLDLHFELSLARKPWLSAQELSVRLAPGAAAQMGALGLAENRNGKVFILDVERTVEESLTRREKALTRLPTVRARDLEGKLRDVFEATRGHAYEPMRGDITIIQLLRARAEDSEILERWKRALLSNGFPPVRTLVDLNRTWGAHGEE